MKNKKLIIVLLLIENIHALKCPPDWNPSPCFCTEKIIGLGSVICSKTSNINSTADLTRIFRYTNNTIRVYSLEIHDANLEYLNETAVFGNFEFESILIVRSKTKWISNDFLKGQSSLVELNFVYNEFERFNFEAVNSLKIKELRIQDNPLVDIRPNSFTPSVDSRISWLSLSYNRLRIIRKFTFTELPRLRRLFLSENEITTIEENAFYLLRRSEPLAVYLNRNNLTSDGIHRNAFPAGLKLSVLELSENKLTSLPMHIFEPILEVMADIENSFLEEIHSFVTCHFIGSLGNQNKLKTL